MQTIRTMLQHTPALSPARALVRRGLEQHRERRRHRRMLSFYQQFIAPGDLVFDVGANLGDRTAIFAALGAHVVAVEPQEVCVRRLRARFARHPHVVVVPTALSDHEGEAELAIASDALTISTLSQRWRQEGRFSSGYTWNATERVRLSTLDTLIAQYGCPAFCKIDVEGYELSVLRGLSHQVPILCFEFTRELWQDAQACLIQLASLGSARFNCSLGESMTWQLPIWVTVEDLAVALQGQADPLLWGDIYASYGGRDKQGWQG